MMNPQKKKKRKERNGTEKKNPNVHARQPDKAQRPF